MTEAGWTRGKDVKVEGWYWWEVEEETGLSLKVVQVEKGFTWIESEGRDVLYVVGYGGLLENKPGRFKGPLTPDSYQQGWEAGLREAIQRADELVDASGRRDIWAKKAIDRTLRISKYLCEEYALHPDGRPKRTVKKKQK